MTDLQMSLIGAGGVFLLAVLIYNKWQEYRAKKSVEKAFDGEHDDVLMQPGSAPAAPSARTMQSAAPAGAPAQRSARVEPTFHADAAAAALRPETLQTEPAMAEFSATGEADIAAVTSAPLLDEDDSLEGDAVIGGLIDPIIDCLIPLELEAPLLGRTILPLLKNLSRVGSKLVQVVGMTDGGNWETVAFDGTYIKLLVGVQMASRASALNELEFSELVMRVRSVADELAAEPDVPDMMDVMANARALHRFMLDHDAQLGVNVQSNGAPWAINTLLVSLEKQGFDLRPDGTFVMPDGDGAFLFSITTNAPVSSATTQRLTLLLDAPRVQPARDGFGALTACAKSLAARLGATVVDDGNQPLQDAALLEIRQQLVAFYDEMQDADIAAGSARALRLFS